MSSRSTPFVLLPLNSHYDKLWLGLNIFSNVAVVDFAICKLVLYNSAPVSRVISLNAFILSF